MRLRKPKAFGDPTGQVRLATLQQRQVQREGEGPLHLTTPNAAVGQVVVDGFADAGTLGDGLGRHLYAAIARASREGPPQAAHGQPA